MVYVSYCISVLCSLLLGGVLGKMLLLEYEIDGENQTDECCEVIPVKLLPLEEDICNDAEDDKRDDFLYDLQLHQRKWPAIIDESNSIGRHQETILDAGNCPREENHDIERPVGRYSRLIELQVTIPSKCHKDVAGNQ